ncbi:hypothetical protein [Crenothrix sp.]|uniref:hypothetical protein n=1 Tax=Crenothrix sp. TaxID=3100433 RepID=UPI00374D0FCA
MEPYVSVIKNLFFSWYQFSLENPGYPGVIALMAGLAVALMMSTSHRSKLGKLRRKFEANNFVREQEHLKINYQLDNVQQQLHQAKEQLIEKEQQIAKNGIDNQAQQALAAHSIAELETQVYQHNKNMTHAVQALEADFGMEQQPILVSDGLDSSVLWQRHTSVVKQLAERSQNHQKMLTELQYNQQTLAGQLSDKDAIIQELQEALESQNTHISQLTRDAQMQKDNAQQALQKLISEFESKEQKKSVVVLDTDVNAVASAPNAVQSAAVVEETTQQYMPVETIDEVPVIAVAMALEALPESIAVEAMVEVPDSEEVAVSIIQQPIQEQPLVEKKSWFNPIKLRLSALTGKAKPTSTERGEINAAASVDVLPDLVSAETLQATPVAELTSAAEIEEEWGADKEVDAVEELPLPKKKSWFSPIKAQFDALTGKDKYYG